MALPAALPRLSHRLPVLLLLVAALAGCATAPRPRELGQTELDARALDAAGRHAEAAVAWRSLAAQGRGVDDAAWHLYAAEALWRSAQLEAAAAELAQSPRRRLQGIDPLRHDLVSAALALAAGRTREALPVLAAEPQGLPPTLQSDWLDLRARALLAAGDRFAAAAALVRRAPLLEGEARARVLREAGRHLQALPDADLRQGIARLDAESALLPLALREARRRGLAIDTLAAAPVALAEGRLPPAIDGYHPPRRMAVLLPLSGERAAAGRAVRDGLLAGFHGETRHRPTLVFLDTGGTPEGARRARDRALAEGADLLLGPLGREEVVALAAEPMPVAWLALNRMAVTAPGSGSFALTPEDEGAAVAQRLLDQGLQRALAVAEPDDTAQRALAGFRERFTLAGGQLLAVAALDPIGGTAAQALATLAPQAGEAQALFLAARAPALRILLPQREAHGLGGLPVLATSLVQAGADPRLDRELDGLQFPELPWLLGLGGGPGDAEALARRLPSARGSAARLFAFGYDAWTVATHLDALRGGALRNGATGGLGIDAAGVVERSPAWAEFAEGRSRPVAPGSLLPLPLAPIRPSGPL
ncbi:penicillin-binding protein activator [Silanimonas sp.]|uniref:penicillin-binding protein activator n=1 Tax=Silanimonas sp. TaxID=1929290 RepID=UPI001BB9358A|nr:penicillin-binding protein activator [Silanimonas sp.]MBS3896157.1 penicillin-binding protein activator [Silanimonas sp.]MBS3924905.1 penicillin-binding protein activator [Xanthomonadaceae bacterium]